MLILFNCVLHAAVLHRAPRQLRKRKLIITWHSWFGTSGSTISFLPAQIGKDLESYFLKIVCFLYTKVWDDKHRETPTIFCICLFQTFVHFYPIDNVYEHGYTRSHINSLESRGRFNLSNSGMSDCKRTITHMSRKPTHTTFCKIL